MEKNMLHSSEKLPVLFVPGGIMLAELVYGPLLGVICDQIRPFPKELEVYAAETPPPGDNALGSLSTRYFEHEARILTGLFPDIQVEEYEGRSHFDPPHRAEPEDFWTGIDRIVGPK